MPGSKTIRAELLKYYSILILGIMLLFSLGFYFYATSTIRRNVVQAFEDLDQSQSKFLDDQVRNMDAFSMSLIFSDRVRQELLKSRTSMTYADNQIRKDLLTLNALVYEMLGPFRSFWQLNCYSLDGSILGVGNDPFITRTDPLLLLNAPLVARSLVGKGKKEVFLEKASATNPFTRRKSEAAVISLSRAFRDGDGIGPVRAVLEIQNKAEELFGEMQSAMTRRSMALYVFGSAGELVFPYEDPPDPKTLAPFRPAILQETAAMGHFPAVDRRDNRNVLVFFSKSDYTHWTVALVVGQDQVLLPLKRYSFLILVLLVLTIVAAQVASYFVARRITIPIQQLHRTVREMSLTLIPAHASRNRALQLNELKELDLEFQELCIRLKKSMEESVLLRAQEAEARWLSLQARMNPHFLYNILSTISAMAEEKLDSEIVTVCEDLSQMLRYTCDDSASMVLLGDELDHTMKFLGLMKTRFGSRLAFDVSVPERMRSIPMPKLILQPIVENSIKHDGCAVPPLRIAVSGEGSAGAWCITVRDNAGGFRPDTLNAIRRKVSDFDTREDAAGLGVGGMGIANIYSRLRMKFGEHAVLRIENADGGGAVVTFGRSAGG
jgi:two-component system sensor histidine kinase YesM